MKRDEYSMALGSLQSAAARPSMFVLSSGAVFVSGSKGLCPSASSVLEALRAKSQKLATVAGEGPLSPTDVLAAVERGDLGPVASSSHVATGASPDDALLAVRDKTGVNFEDMLVFTRDAALARAAQRCGAVVHRVNGCLDAAALQAGLDEFGKAYLAQRGY